MTQSRDRDRAEQEAAEWLARLNSRSVSSAELEQFYVWRREPGKSEAFARVEALWRECSGLGGDRDIAEAVREALDRPERSINRPRLGGRLGWGAGAVSALALAALVWLAPPGGQSFDSAVGEQRSLTLADGTRLQLNTDSRAVVHYDSAERRVTLERGEALFEVMHDPARSFIVESGPLQVRAIGTRFDVRRLGGETRIVLLEGSVATTIAGGTSEHRLAAGQSLSVDRHGAARLEMVDLDQVLGWTMGRLVFRNTPLAAAVAEVNRYSARKIELRADDLAGETVDGAFATGDIDAFVSAVTRLFDLRALPDGDQQVILTRA